MIIAALAKAADHLDLPPDGYQQRPVPFTVTVAADGSRAWIGQAVADDPKAKPARQDVPAVTRTVNVAPQLACDTGVYSLGLAKPAAGGSDYAPFPPSPRDVECHASWTSLLRSWSEDSPSGEPAARTVLSWLDNGRPGLTEWLEANPESQALLATGMVAFRIDGSSETLHKSPSAQRFWSAHVNAAKAGSPGLCSSCGQIAPLVSSLPNGVLRAVVPGASQATVALTSANDDFTSAARTGSKPFASACLCINCALRAVAALNRLAADEHHSWRGVDTRTVWWLRSGSSSPLLARLDAPRPEDVERLFSQLRVGSDEGAVDLEDEFYALTYSGRQARMVVRSWVQRSFGDVAGSIARYFYDSAVARPADSARQWEPLWVLAQAGGVWRSRAGKTEVVAPLRAHEALLRSALTDSTPPPSLLAAVVVRSRAEIGRGDPTNADQNRIHAQREHARACIARLILNRSNLGGSVPESKLDESVNEPAYLCGRLFAEYEWLQRAALGKDVNATIAARWYGTAMTRPATVFPSLARLSQAHLQKLRTNNRGGTASALDAQITGIAARLATLPKTLDVPGQALWMLGYYQQRAHNITAARAYRVDDHATESTEGEPE